MCINLVIVDDSDVDILIIQDAISDLSASINFNSFSNPEEFLKFIGGFHPEMFRIEKFIIISDINMPRINGFEMLDKIRARPEMALVPVIMFSSSSSQEDALKSIARGANAFLSKPLQIEAYQRLIRTTIEFWTHHLQG
ncbi:Response regulator receiver domain-containing protein [Cyclobacterium lianum]|uniref:Response regulator receiver domain-containing protein n=1 Tax=Cyclobacterium lianum TaxID=388280 RepID=A0A1M7M661_9BACT|nr:response regulator [Cyclobacterium lianum]SHM86207.1 Response regulator receiver domain-containing protein [Cyclobacterium lianum]